MIFDFDIERSKHGIEKQRMVTDIITSQRFINTVAKKVEKELENEGPYIYHSPAERFETWVAAQAEKENTQNKKVKKKNLFFRSR